MFYCEICSEWMDCWNNCENCDIWKEEYPKANYSTFCFIMQDPWGDFKEIKVVGNIIDNPELVGGNYEY